MSESGTGRDDDSTVLVQVRMLQMPVDLWARAQEHSESLQREFALMTTPQAEQQADGRHVREVPQRLLELIEAVRAQYSDVGTEQEEQLFAAADAGQPVLAELVYSVPPEVTVATRQLSDVLDEADEYCRQGEHLLTLATPEELVAFRRWFLGEFERQVAGQSPVPWPEYRER